MECIVANVEHIRFDIEIALDEQYGALPLPFNGMDKSIAAVCQFYTSANGCQKGALCPFRHVRGDRTIVCKHWLRGLCKKGDQCEFLHEYDMTKMPECYFYSRFNACHNKECPFLHIDPESKIRDCPWYDRGFCRHGPHCRHRHVRRVLCTNYLAGHCPAGAPTCKYMHPRFELPAPPPLQDAPGAGGGMGGGGGGGMMGLGMGGMMGKDGRRPPVIVCHFCGEHGHKAIHCGRNSEVREVPLQNNMPPPQGNGDGNEENNGNAAQQPQHHNPHHHHHHHHHNQQMHPHQPNHQLFNRSMPKKLEDVTCYKCGNKGHYANRCPKGHLAFLSQAKALQDNKDKEKEQS